MRVCPSLGVGDEERMNSAIFALDPEYGGGGRGREVERGCVGEAERGERCREVKGRRKEGEGTDRISTTTGQTTLLNIFKRTQGSCSECVTM